MKRVIPESDREYGKEHVIERPDGFYWQSPESRREHGPFETLLEAVSDMQAAGETDFEPGESLEEAEDELGIATWIDPDTGEPAEDGVPRIRDS